MRKTIIVSFALFHSFLSAQAPEKPSAEKIYSSIQKLNFFGSALYIAAHPDDENTALISYLANHSHARAAYFSFTRGGGGQNLIGPEIGSLLGVIRTRELLEARRIDGGVQFFSSARDFGYSKNPNETLSFWNREQITDDLLRVIIQFRPDVIINRFDHRTPGTTHGHHTTSAIISYDAFKLINGPQSKSIENIKSIGDWRPARLLFNTNWWFYGGQEAFEQADKTGLLKMDIGAFYPTKGLSNNEISALSRSRHSSQGFGMTGSRGAAVEYFETLAGSPAQSDIFEGINTTWTRVKGGKAIGEILEKAEKDFDFTDPAASIPALLEAYERIQKLEDPFWREIKLEEIQKIIAACAGLFYEGIAPSPVAVAGERIEVDFELINRSEVPVTLESVSLNSKTISKNLVLNDNKGEKFKAEYQISAEPGPSSAYWLDSPGSVGMYGNAYPELTGLPITPPAVRLKFNLLVDGHKITLNAPLVYKYLNPALGEVYEPFYVIPEASIKMEEEVLVFSGKKEKEVQVEVKSFTEALQGDLTLNLPEGWSAQPLTQRVNLKKKGEQKAYSFKITPPAEDSTGELMPELRVGEKLLTKTIYELNYSHIPAQKVVMSSAAKVAHVEVHKRGERIGYIEGAGDSLPENLKQIGYEVEVLKPAEITPEKLKDFDAVILGVRAFNVIPELAYKNRILFDYVKEGGNLLVQYNTDARLVTEEISPLPLQLSRNRVTEEDSKVIFLSPEHPVLNSPNKITQDDFQGWVQERGLYFPDNWDLSFVPILSMHDTNEEAMNGSLLVAPYGKGYYIYTGLSFFRELPAGVPGAYRLLANILSLGK